MRGPRAPTVELNKSSLNHVRKLLRQLLEQVKLPAPAAVEQWERALLPILLQATEDLDPDIRGGDEIDVRHFVKIKRIPGATPDDTTYLSGVVFTKNLALKSMPKEISSPRVMLLAFPLEYQEVDSAASSRGRPISRDKVNHFMSIEPVINNEKKYLEDIVSTIVARHPQVVLSEKNISLYALNLLQKHNIAVAYNVNPNVIRAVSRTTQAEIITSAHDLLRDPENLLTPQVGFCEHFEIKTYVVDGLRKKTFIFMSGCPKQLGCTIVLRGGDMSTLEQIKYITKFMAYVVYNLKLESCLMVDEFVSMPSSMPLASQTSRSRVKMLPNVSKSSETDEDNVDQLSGYYDGVVSMHNTRIVSTSPYVQIPQPYLLRKARQTEGRLQNVTKYINDFDHNKEITNEDETEEKSADSESDIAKQVEDMPYGLKKVINSSETILELIRPDILDQLPNKGKQILRQITRAVLQLEQDKLEYISTVQKRQWETYLSQTTSYLFDPFTYQHITILYSLVCNVTTAPCSGPELVSIEYYREGDCTLGQFIEGLCDNMDQPCSDGCSYLLSQHYRSYVHGNGRVNVYIEKCPCRIPGMENSILMWSYCTICQVSLSPLRMSEDTWKYSFGKYLELSFWSSPLSLRASICPHDIHKNHVRVFGLRGMAVKFEYFPIELLEIAFPRTQLLWKPQIDARLRTEEYFAISERIRKYYDSVRSRLDSVKIDDFSSSERDEECRNRIEILRERAQSEQADLVEHLKTIYIDSSFRDYLSLNATLRSLQERVVQWDLEFAEFDRNFFPSEKDIARLTAMQLKKMFLERDTTSNALGADDNSEATTEELGSAVELMPVAADRENSINGVSDTGAESTEDDSPLEYLKVRPNTYLLSPEYNVSSSGFPSPGLSTSSKADPMATASLNRSASEPLPSDHQNSVHILKQSLAGNDRNSPRPKEPVNPDSHLSPSNSTTDGPCESTSLQESNGSAKGDDSNALVAPPSMNRSVTQGNNKNEVVETPPSKIPILAKRSVSGAEESLKSSLSRRRAPPERFSLPPQQLKLRFTQGTTRELARQLQLRAGSSGALSGQSKVISLARHFDQLSREFEKERARERKKLTAGRSRAVVSSKPIVEVYRTIEDAVIEDEDEFSEDGHLSDDDVLSDHGTISRKGKGRKESEHERGGTSEQSISGSDISKSTALKNSQGSGYFSLEHDINSANPSSSSSQPASKQLMSQSQPPTPATASSEISYHPELTPVPEKLSLMTLLANFWADRSASGWRPLDYPLQPSEHIFIDSDVIVREDEPSSLIAFCLSSPDYIEKLHQIRTTDSQVYEESSSSEDENKEELRKWLLKETGTHLKYQFQEGSAKLSCKIFYAELFDAFRTLCGCEESYIQSLSRCVKWDSTGGKSGSAFLKTLDDRLVVKQLSPSELDSFIKFAPSYFQYMAQVFFHDLPSVIAKIMGFYQIQVRNPITNKSMKMDILVMENLFYDRQLSRIFDLKGSMRNRHVEQTGKANEVLLDENMVEYIFESPLFVREYAKKILRASLWNDTLFLAKMNVMDYSLVIAIDPEKHQLVVGIIDCLRTFTWDKKLESWVKERGLVGGGGKVPTVVTPRQYKNSRKFSLF
ncbi:hypothetical protein V1511DRAFT_521267 [Dipodascopsis uninucleata]